MKKYLCVLLAIIPFLAGCDKASEFTRLSLPFSQTLTLPANPMNNLQLPVTTPDIKMNIDSLLALYNAKSDMIQSVSLQKMDVKLTAPEGGNLSFLKSVNIYVISNGLDTVKVAGIDEVPESTGNTLSLTTGNVNLKNYIVNEKFKLKVDAISDKATAVEQKLKIDLSLLLDLKVFGL